MLSERHAFGQLYSGRGVARRLHQQGSRESGLNVTFNLYLFVFMDVKFNQASRVSQDLPWVVCLL